MNIIWTKTSSLDLEHIWNFIANDSEYYATSFLEKIINSVDNLLELPEIGRIVPEFKIKNVREIIFQKYRIIYKVEKDHINIITIIHGSRDLKKHLKKSDLS